MRKVCPLFPPTNWWFLWSTCFQKPRVNMSCWSYSFQQDPAIQWAETLGASVWGAVQHVEHIHEKEWSNRPTFHVYWDQGYSLVVFVKLATFGWFYWRFDMSQRIYIYIYTEPSHTIFSREFFSFPLLPPFSGPKISSMNQTKIHAISFLKWVCPAGSFFLLGPLRFGYRISISPQDCQCGGGVSKSIQRFTSSNDYGLDDVCLSLCGYGLKQKNRRPKRGKGKRPTKTIQL